MDTKTDNTGTFYSNKFKMRLLEDFPDDREYIETRLAELRSRECCADGNHVLGAWRTDILRLAQIRLELDRKYKKNGSASSGASGEGGPSLPEIPTELPSPDMPGEGGRMEGKSLGDAYLHHGDRALVRSLLAKGLTPGKMAHTSHDSPGGR